ncbi:MAG: AAA family ATPase [Rhodocyclaceae bacterium]|nr:AAA family ATPase [Rhodocyclaceae bacterium]MCA3075701.1 AAA family ATPase [Rhodocyclaceae bacterium]MCA3089944.1 AAA family ATPase [Rhodocyclaceae bacterium]MCA3093592.1 AAA family ATPase [Rhodocyclaceae bacterium]MCA3096409.1 AAA family ATPase [Rhodocyclaceae bacterium]
MPNQETPPLLQYFTLRGVHGYKDITVQFAGAATVIVAENGTGKTTVLSALNAFLTRRFHRLAALPFSALECKFLAREDAIRMTREDFGSAAGAGLESVKALAKSAELPEEALLDFLQNEYIPANFDRLLQTPVISQLYLTIPGDYQEIKRALDEAHALLNSSLSERAKEIASDLRGLIGRADVVFLPTYRRIERPLLRSSRKREAIRTNWYAPTREKNDYSYEGIAFGLSDIEARLGELSEEIERTSNFGYRGLSARILNDMLKGQSFQLPLGIDALPDIGSLSLFLGRLGRVENNLGQIFENIETLYDSGEIHSKDFEFLRYFLSRLNSVIDQTKTTEQRIEQFVTVCNSYLTMSSDEKRLAFDPRTLKVVVENSWANCIVPLDALSSGEKQIVSLMAKLYLYKGSKVVLIDEPELSLSIDWQRKVLPDVMASGSVTQMLAITHSPFIFENELDQFTVGLRMERTGENVDGFAS